MVSIADSEFLNFVMVRVLLRILTKTNGFEGVIDCEIRARKILEDKEFIKQYGEDADLGEIFITFKKAF